jgi:cell division FtsZ-interacting protein ZapD
MELKTYPEMNEKIKTYLNNGEAMQGYARQRIIELEQDNRILTNAYVNLDEKRDKQVSELRKENERYRKALEEIVNVPYGDSDWLEIILKYESIAEDALKTL